MCIVGVTHPHHMARLSPSQIITYLTTPVTSLFTFTIPTLLQTFVLLSDILVRGCCFRIVCLLIVIIMLNIEWQHDNLFLLRTKQYVVIYKIVTNSNTKFHEKGCNSLFAHKIGTLLIVCRFYEEVV